MRPEQINEEWLAFETQAMGRSSVEIAEELGCHHQTVKKAQTLYGIGPPSQLLQEDGAADLLVEIHGSPAQVAEATGIPCLRIMRARVKGR